MHIITLTTCHNRRECTLSVLSDLRGQQLPGGVSISHVIVDDGSTDGTAEAVRDQFPEVEIVKGNGKLYWAGGMRYGWAHLASKKSFDYLFVYNDDVRLNKTAILEVLEASEILLSQNDAPHVIVGSFKSRDGKLTTYGGRIRSSRWHPLKFAHIIEPNGLLQKADTLNMNGAIISREALEQIGFLSDYFIHSGADFEFGLKLIKSGGGVYVAGHHIGTCDLTPEMSLQEEGHASLSNRLKLLFDIKREPFNQRFNFYRRHGGHFWPFLFVSPYITVWARYLFSCFACKKKSGKVQSGIK